MHFLLNNNILCAYIVIYLYTYRSSLYQGCHTIFSLVSILVGESLLNSTSFYKTIAMNIKIFSLFTLLYFLPNLSLVAQTIQPSLIVNEIGIVPQTKERYIELLVLGNTSNLTANQSVDLSGWSIDNNSSTAIPDIGFISLGAAFANMYPGTLILIYDEENPHPDIDPTADGLPNASGIYQLPLSSPQLEKHYFNSSDTYSDTNPFNWDESLDFNTDSDVLMIRDANQNLQHAISWAGSDFNEAEQNSVINITSGLNPSSKAISLEAPCSIFSKRFQTGQDHQIGPTTTPGRYNSSSNGIWINNLQSTGTSIITLSLECFTHQDADNSGNLGIIGGSFSGGKKPYEVSWNGPQSGSLPIMNNAGYFHIDNLEPGTYTIQITDSRGCQDVCQSSVLRVERKDPICEGDCKEIGVEEKPGECYLWEPSDGLSEPHPSMWSPCPEQTTHYNLTISNEDGDIVETKTFQVNVVNLEVTIAPDPIIQCGSEEIELTAMTDSDPVDFNWSNSKTTQTINENALGEYSVTITDPNIGCTATDAVEIIAAEDCEGISSWFIENGFQSEEVSSTQDAGLPLTSNSSNGACIPTDYANLIVTINGIDYNLEEKMCELQFDIEDVPYDLFITSSSNENMCSTSPNGSNFIQTKNLWESGTKEIMLWAHVCQNPDGTATLFYNLKAYDATQTPQVTNDCKRKALNTITNPWVRKAFIDGEGKDDNNITICGWHKAIIAGTDGDKWYKNAIGRIGEGLAAEFLDNHFKNISSDPNVTISINPGGGSGPTADPGNRHVDISMRVMLISPLFSSPQIDRIQVPQSDVNNGQFIPKDFLMLNPNLPSWSASYRVFKIEIKTFSGGSYTYSTTKTAIDQVNGAIGRVQLPNYRKGILGMVIIPKQRYDDITPSSKLIDLIQLVEDWESSNLVNSIFFPFSSQQRNYFLLIDLLRSDAEAAYKGIRKELSNLNCNCQ